MKNIQEFIPQKETLLTKYRNMVLEQIRIVKKMEPLASQLVLVLDELTMKIISTLFPESVLNKEGIMMFQQIEKKDYVTLPNTKIICLLGQTKTNINFLKAELTSKPRSKQYYLYFIGFLQKDFIDDTLKKFCNTYIKLISDVEILVNIIHDNTFDFELNTTKNILNDKIKIAEGLSSIVSTLKSKADIVYDLKSPLSNEIACLTSNCILQNKDKFLGKSKTLLIILDRNVDIISPLLTTWHYFSMINEHLSLKRNLITFNDQKYATDLDKDEFMRNNFFATYGTFTDNLKIKAQQLKQIYSTIKNVMPTKESGELEIEKLEDIVNDKLQIKSNKPKKEVNNNLMMKAMECTDIKKYVKKHTDIITKISEICKKNRLLEISGLEQQFICGNVDAKLFESILLDPNVNKREKIKLGIIYKLRQTSIIDKVVDVIQKYDDRIEKLLEEQTGYSISKIAAEFLKISKNAGHIGTRKIFGELFRKQLKYNFADLYYNHENLLVFNYKPKMINIVQDIMNNELGSYERIMYNPPNTNYENTIIFFVKGITCDEIKIVDEMNKTKGWTRFIAGGTSILNTGDFIENIIQNN